MLVEHCGLNPMAGKARAGCPLKNIQATLDCLTSAGFRIAMYEEAADTDASVGKGASAGSKSRIKERMLAQLHRYICMTSFWRIVKIVETLCAVLPPDHMLE